MPRIGETIVLSCQGKNFDKKMNATIMDVKRNGWLCVRREDGYVLNIRNKKGIIYKEKNEICREKSRQVFEIVRDVLLDSAEGDQEALCSGKQIRDLIQNHF